MKHENLLPSHHPLSTSSNDDVIVPLDMSLARDFSGKQNCTCFRQITERSLKDGGQAAC